MTTVLGGTRIRRYGNFLMRAQGFPELRVIQQRRTVTAESDMSHTCRTGRDARPRREERDAGLVDGIVRHISSGDAVDYVLDIPRDVDQPGTLANSITVE